MPFLVHLDCLDLSAALCLSAPLKSSCILFARDARGMTPFMLAVSGRAYPAAITVLEAAQKMAKGKLLSHHSAFCRKLICHLQGQSA